MQNILKMIKLIVFPIAQLKIEVYFNKNFNMISIVMKERAKRIKLYLCEIKYVPSYLYAHAYYLKVHLLH